jgi:hypothetical protein
MRQRSTLIQNLPWPLFFKEGKFLILQFPLEKGGLRGISLAREK